MSEKAFSILLDDIMTAYNMGNYDAAMYLLLDAHKHVKNLYESENMENSGVNTDVEKWLG